MKKKKTLIIYYIITLVLSLISIYSFNHKSNDFFTALSSIASDFTLIVSVILVTYSIFYSADYLKDKIIKKDKKFYLKEIISLLILILSMTIVFISFINIFAHKNIIEFMKDVVNKKENMDIIKLFIESLIIYFLIFLFVVNGIIISNKQNDEENSYMIPFVIIIFIAVLSFILIGFGIRIIYSIILLDIVLFISSLLLWRNYYGESKKKK